MTATIADVFIMYSICIHYIHYSQNAIDINTKSVKMKTQILTKLIGRHVIVGASKTRQRNFLLASSRKNSH